MKLSQRDPADYLFIIGRRDNKLGEVEWLPKLDARRTSGASQPQEIHLVVKMTVRRFKRGFIYLGNLN